MVAQRSCVPTNKNKLETKELHSYLKNIFDQYNCTNSGNTRTIISAIGTRKHTHRARPDFLMFCTTTKYFIRQLVDTTC